MAYQYNHPHIFHAAVCGGVLVNHRQPTYIQLIIDFHMIDSPAHFAAAYDAQPPILHALFLYEETTFFYNYPSNHGSAQPPQAIALYPALHNLPTNSAAIRRRAPPEAIAPHQTFHSSPTNSAAIQRRRFRPAYDGGVAVLDASPAPIAARRRRNSMAAPHPTFHNSPTNSTAIQERRVAVLDASPVPIADRRRRNSMAAPPQRAGRLSKKVVARFLKENTREKTTAAADGDDDKVCAVCLDDFCGRNQKVVVLRCRHEFHGDCIGKWLQKKNVCPLCKAVAIDIWSSN